MLTIISISLSCMFILVGVLWLWSPGKPTPFVDENGNKLIEGGYGYDPDVQKFIAHLDKVKENYKKTHP